MRRIGIPLLGVLALGALVLGGCRSQPETRSGGTAALGAGPAEYLTRLEVMDKIRENMNNLATLSANFRVLLTHMKETMPAPGKETLKARAGKVYKAIFRVTELNGFIALERPPIGVKRVRFSADFPMSDQGFSMWALGDDFWIAVPNPDAGPRQRLIYKGALDRTVARPEAYFSLRPQDILDLMLYDELFPDPERDKGLEYMEVWPHSYIITVLRIARIGMIYSRIWVNRQTLQVSHHQIFDADGTILAEARFREYAEHPATTTKKVMLPTQALLVWPREELAMEVTFSTVKVNQVPRPTIFTPPSDRDATTVTIPARMPRLGEERPAPVRTPLLPLPPSSPGDR